MLWALEMGKLTSLLPALRELPARMQTDSEAQLGQKKAGLLLEGGGYCGHSSCGESCAIL